MTITQAKGITAASPITVDQGGTGATDASAARTNLGFSKAAVQPITVYTFNARADSTTSLTAMASAAQFFPQNSKRAIMQADLTNYTQARITVNVITGATTEGNLYAVYKNAFVYATDAATDMLDLCTSRISTLLTASTAAASEWVNIVSAARTNTYIGVVQVSGDATNTPGVGSVTIQVR